MNPNFLTTFKGRNNDYEFSCYSRSDLFPEEFEDEDVPLQIFFNFVFVLFEAGDHQQRAIEVDQSKDSRINPKFQCWMHRSDYQEAEFIGILEEKNSSVREAIVKDIRAHQHDVQGIDPSRMV